MTGFLSCRHPCPRSLYWSWPLVSTLRPVLSCPFLGLVRFSQVLSASWCFAAYLLACSASPFPPVVFPPGLLGRHLPKWNFLHVSHQSWAEYLHLPLCDFPHVLHWSGVPFPFFRVGVGGGGGVVAFPFPFSRAGVGDISIGFPWFPGAIEGASPNVGAPVVQTGALFGRVTGPLMLVLSSCGGVGGVVRSMKSPPSLGGMERSGSAALLINVSPSLSVVEPYLSPRTGFGGGGPLS